jgi:hypothetical protein
MQEFLEQPSIHHAEDDSACGYSSTDSSKDHTMPNACAAAAAAATAASCLQEILEEPSIHHAEDDSARGYSSTYTVSSKDPAMPAVHSIGKPTAEAVEAPRDVMMTKDDGMV